MIRRERSVPATLDLFADDTLPAPCIEHIGPRSFVLRGFALSRGEHLLPALERVLSEEIGRAHV